MYHTGYNFQHCTEYEWWVGTCLMRSWSQGKSCQFLNIKNEVSCSLVDSLDQAEEMPLYSCFSESSYCGQVWNLSKANNHDFSSSAFSQYIGLINFQILIFRYKPYLVIYLLLFTYSWILFANIVLSTCVGYFHKQCQLSLPSFVLSLFGFDIRVVSAS